MSPIETLLVKAVVVPKGAEVPPRFPARNSAIGELGKAFGIFKGDICAQIDRSSFAETFVGSGDRAAPFLFSGDAVEEVAIHRLAETDDGSSANRFEEIGDDLAGNHLIEIAEEDEIGWVAPF